MADVVLLVFEGEKTELQISESLNRHFFTSNPLITSFNAEIYQLWRTLQDDDDLDLLEIIRERSDKNRNVLKNLQRKDVAQIFLFFDYDGHAKKASDAAISAMLTHFNNETENGKLYISYPMVEALKHIQREVCFHEVVVNAKTKSQSGLKSYKQLIEECGSVYPDLTQLEKENWNHIVIENLKKANFIIYDVAQMPATYRDVANLKQLVIFRQQLQKYILPHQLVAVLSAFPFFIIEYFGEKAYAELEPTPNPA